MNIFSSLQDVSGLIWMKDNYQNIIGLLPKWQCIALDNQRTLMLERTLLLDRRGLVYQTHSTDLLFADCVKQAWQKATQHARVDNITSTSTEKTQPKGGFSGGLMGFVGYDYAASQHIDLKHQQHTQAPHAMLGNYDIFLKQVADGWELY
ncbi:hypothetical protein RJJ65_34975, partial [Rhizobium hidalgonense]